MTITEMMQMHPRLFYQPAGVAWYAGERFMHTRALPIAQMPTHVARCPDPSVVAPDDFTDAASLVALYVKHPADSVWRDYLWSGDTDKEGQRVYLGGTANGRGLELHRHLHITARWRMPLWVR